MASDGGTSSDDRWSAAALLADPLRRRVYAAVVEHDEGMSRDVVARELDLPRSTAAVEASRPDVPFDTVDSLFRFGHGLTL